MVRIILFDGVCNLCNNSVQFILKRDLEGKFKFASLQGNTGRALRNQYDIGPDLSSFILVENNKLYTKSTAALHVCKHLNGSWKMLQIFLFVPRSIRDTLYDIVAKNRYKWFGKNEHCMLPSPKWKNRFLD